MYGCSDTYHWENIKGRTEPPRGLLKDGLIWGV